MALIYDGIRVFNPAIGGSILAQDHQDFQDQMILGMEERMIAISMTGVQAESPWAYQTYNAVDPPYWLHQNNPGGETVEYEFPYMPQETKITEISVIICGDGVAAEGGDISLYNKVRSDVTPVLALWQAIDATNPWALNNVITKVTVSGLSIEPSVEESAYLVFEASTVAAVRNLEIWSAEYSAWFHKGT